MLFGTWSEDRNDARGGDNTFSAIAGNLCARAGRNKDIPFRVSENLIDTYVEYLRSVEHGYGLIGLTKMARGLVPKSLLY